MKRFLAILVLLASTATVAFAQKNTISGSMMINTTDIIKTKKVFAKATVERGFEQEASFAWSWGASYETIHHINLNYIGGFRFNHHLFVGGGTGLDFGAGYSFKPYVIENREKIYHSPTTSYSDRYYDLPIQKVSIPLYAHFKVYFMKTRLAPFLAFSGGVLFSAPKKLEVYENDGRSYSPKFGDYIRTEKYGAVTGMFEVMPGVNYQYSNNLGFNFQFGYATRSGHEWDRDLNENDYSIQRTWYHGFTLRLGFVF